MRALEFITGHVIYNPAYTYKFQLKTTKELQIALWMHRFMRIARFNCHAIREVKKPFVKVHKINAWSLCKFKIILDWSKPILDKLK